MIRQKKNIAVLGLLLGAALTAGAFSLLVPFKAYQVPLIGYNLPGDIGGPGAPSEGYRWNVPEITYAIDQSFFLYFGTNGVRAIEQAFEILNNLPPMSRITNDAVNLYSTNGAPFPTDAKGPPNLLYETLGLNDVKSTALTFLMEELGLTEPERYTWALRGRAILGMPPTTNYAVIKQNFDPITRSPSSYVNDHLYTYTIEDPFAINPLVTDAVELPVDPTDPFVFSSVAGKNLFAGQFYINLTRDDVGGLRFLYGTNNIVTENLLGTVTGGLPLSGSSSPWAPYLGLGTTNFVGTNILFVTNVVGTNLIVQGLRPGIDKLRFRRVNFDSIIGQQFATVTNLYMDVVITNARPILQPVQRAIAAPDIIFAAEDLGLAANLIPFTIARTGTAGWQNNDAINGRAAQGGPGVIPPSVTIRFTDQFPFFLNFTPSFLTEGTGISSGVWASFDGTTNAPVIYPAYGGITLQDLQNQILGTGP
jgi:hypothetical protein